MAELHEHDDPELRDRVKRHIQAKGVTYVELCRRLGWHTHKLWRLLSGRREFTYSALKSIATALGMTVAELDAEPPAGAVVDGEVEAAADESAA